MVMFNHRCIDQSNSTISEYTRTLTVAINQKYTFFTGLFNQFSSHFWVQEPDRGCARSRPVRQGREHCHRSSTSAHLRHSALRSGVSIHGSALSTLAVPLTCRATSRCAPASCAGPSAANPSPESNGAHALSTHSSKFMGS